MNFSYYNRKNELKTLNFSIGESWQDVNVKNKFLNSMFLLVDDEFISELTSRRKDISTDTQMADYSGISYIKSYIPKADIVDSETYFEEMY